jgi:hypothetical protein
MWPKQQKQAVRVNAPWDRTAVLCGFPVFLKREGNASNVPTDANQAQQLPARKLARSFGAKPVQKFLIVEIAVAAEGHCRVDQLADAVACKSCVRFHPVKLFGEHRMFSVRIDVEAISPELALSPVAKPISQMISVHEMSLDRLTMFVRPIERALCLADACHRVS